MASENDLEASWAWLLRCDSTTYSLLGVLGILLVVKYLLREPEPELHPFVLQRHSTPSPTRKEGQSPIYTSGVMGGIIPPSRPNYDHKTLFHLISKSETVLYSQGFGILEGGKIRETLETIAMGIHTQNINIDNVAVVISNPTESLLVALSLVLVGARITIVNPRSKLPFLPYSAVFYSPDLASTFPSFHDSTRLIPVDEVLGFHAIGKNKQPDFTPPKDEKAIAITFITPDRMVAFTHVNITAAAVGISSQFKVKKADHFWSLYHPSTPFGFMLAVDILYKNASLTLSTTLEELPKVSPTFIAVTQEHQPSLLGPSWIARKERSSFMFNNAYQSKLDQVHRGIINQRSFSDYIVFNSLRKSFPLWTLTLETIWIEGPISQIMFDDLSVLYSVNIMVGRTLPFLLVPLTASRIGDCQRLTPPGSLEMTTHHIGSPAVTVDIVLFGKESDISNDRVRGELLFRTRTLTLDSNPEFPTNATVPPTEAEVYPQEPTDKPTAVKARNDWLRSGFSAEISTEGKLWVITDP